jgi:hypothetical protein
MGLFEHKREESDPLRDAVEVSTSIRDLADDGIEKERQSETGAIDTL